MRRQVLGLVLAGFMVLPSLVVTEPAAATVPGENGRLVYVDQIDSQVPGITAGEIYTMNPDGSDVRRLTHDAGRWTERPGASDVVVSSNWGPKWSPDGLFIAYLHVDESENYTIRLMDAEGTFIRTISDEFRPAWSLSWSPDGDYLAVDGALAVEAYESGIWIITEAGDRHKMLVHEPLNPTDIWAVGEPAWSPNGDEIAFSARTGADRRDIFLADVATGTYEVTSCGLGWSRQPQWASTGNHFLCTTMPFNDLDDPESIWVTNRATGDSHQVHLLPGASVSEPVPTPSDNDLVFVGLSEAGRSLWSRFYGPIDEDFSGLFLDWQPVQRIAHSVGLVDPVTGKWYLTSLHGMVYSFYYGNPGDYPIMGDWDCSGTDTPGLYRQSDGYVYLRNSNTQGNADIRFYFGNPGDIPIAGDFNGDGCDTVSIYRQSEGRVYLINKLGANDGGLGAADYDYYFGNPGDKPFVGDFDGDGMSTVGLHRESTGLVYFRNSNTQGVAEFEFYFGDPGDRLIAGDWSYDGMDTPAVYRPMDRTFYLRYTNTQGNADEQFTWGQSRWLPVTGYFGPP